MVKNRIPVPKDTEAEVLFKSNHLCAICQKPGGVQIAHIDNNASNNKESNLIILCTYHHDESHKKSPISKSYTTKELAKYKDDWENRVASRRKALSEPPMSRLIRFDGPDVNTIYLEVEPGVIRGFQDALTFNLLGFNWGNVDVYPDHDKNKFKVEQALQKASQSKKVRLKFSNDSYAREIYIIWEDGKKHHVPDPETLNEIGGFEKVESLSYGEFNAIPHGQTLLSIFTVRTRQLMKDAWKELKQRVDN